MFRLNGRPDLARRRPSLPMFLLFLAFLFVIGPHAASAAELILGNGTPIRVFFSPRGGAVAGIVQAVAGARSEILVQAHSLLSPSITRSLLDARERGVQVSVILDKSERQEGMTPAVQLANAGVPVFLDGMHAAANDRVIVIDGRTVITGSLNFTTVSDEMNGENLLIINSPELASLYSENWKTHRAHSDPY
ncbi:MAG: phospholipase D family protein [Deltaproteobacteria bacterium HGW-Deltaproteobacteria-19]|jgi:phosphatidylserine/phosphatidylglycerophosphate/cardiolipin synthase-like enzyme|nr:MAG: phospholipase D family protein [Deltaproteobacteria bacterium HGW-Deltaproteobacteria-19]